jgi:hypothetical protein
VTSCFDYILEELTYLSTNIGVRYICKYIKIKITELYINDI